MSKRVVVTGGDGFLGKRVVKNLWERGGYDVLVPAFKNYDFRHPEQVDQMYRRMEPEIVINLAAVVGGVNANSTQPGKFFYDNLLIGMNVIEGARAYGVQKFVQMGSACEYPKDAPIPLKEADIMSGPPEQSNAPYGIAKRALLTMGQAYRKQYDMNIIHPLSTNLYGPRDNFGENSHFIAAMIRRLFEAKRDGKDVIELWGTGEATRDFLYVDDAAEGIVLAMEHYNSPEPINLGSGHEISIKEVAQMIVEQCSFEGGVVWNPAMPSGQPRRVLDTTKAKQFGWAASTSLELGLSRTIEWYKDSLCEK